MNVMACLEYAVKELRVSPHSACVCCVCQFHDVAPLHEAAAGPNLAWHLATEHSGKLT